jgi:transposase
MVGAVDRYQQVLMPPRKVALVELEGWANKYLQPTDQAVLEATGNARHVYNQLEPLVSRVVVANPYQVKLIAAAAVKTDKRGVLTPLAALRAGLGQTLVGRYDTRSMGPSTRSAQLAGFGLPSFAAGITADGGQESLAQRLAPPQSRSP